ncbi:TRAP transporter large permease [Schinkia azotoformans]|uniref:TRAP transporter large permease n=1 Tax=Schinkia azotoformans TaxID=1454 RepID=UPI002DB736BE|nr:TRAP transporter large permease [Schinkia azotoformans]MEC1715140.1 TRAP transporter large permease [Schinkia azotoformans]MEC1739810.1 TRAP transporter large permease [Schinkia azotoformans]MEC1745565.1 TRAP transporter large permease [Schinkia azotoformans]MEC1760052.1 TRAP transporter large permease [Schinkia azotoformans]MEC1765065.1 TRAP transporter large permease [Schinkia azotoformans]
MTIAIALILLVVLLLVGVPIPFVFLGAVIFTVFSFGYDPSFLVPYGFSQLGNTVLLAIPLFIMAGSLMASGGLGKRIVDFAELFVGRIKGGMGVVTVVACAIFGAMAGSASAALVSIGTIMQPRLEKAGYSRGFAASLISSASVLGLLVPPSAIMILYGWAGNQSVLAAFLSTLIPGIILAIFLSIINIIYMRKRNVQEVDLSGAFEERKSFGKTTVGAIPALLMPVIVLGGIYGGITTPTEAAAAAVVYAIPVGFWIYKELNFKRLNNSFVEAATATGVLMVMLFGIMILSRIIVMERIPEKIMDGLFAISENTVILLLLINLFLIIIGMIMDDVSAVLLATPLLLPVVVQLGVDPIHFAAIIGVNLGLGLITPPTAPILYLGVRMSNAKINTMLGPTLLMIIFAWLPTLLITTFVPEVALFLPRLILGH